MGHQCMVAAAAAAMIMMSYGAVVDAEEFHIVTNHQLEPRGINLRGQAFMRQQGIKRQWEDSSFIDEPQIDYDYFVQPMIATTKVSPVVGQILSVLYNNASKRVGGTPGENLDARNQGDQQHGKTHKQTRTEPYQDEQLWHDKDPFSVFYDSMFPDMESVFPEEETYNKNFAKIPREPVKQSASSSIGPISPLQVLPSSSPVTPLTEVHSPPTTSSPLLSSSLLSPQPSPKPSPLKTFIDSTTYGKLTTKMSLVLEKFGLSKSLTKKIFGEEEKFLKSLVHVKPLREKLNTISHLNLSSVTSKLNLSHLFSKLGLRHIASKLKLAEVASKLGLHDMTLKMNFTDLVSKFDIEDINYIVDLVEIASNLNLKDVASEMNIGHSNAARFLQMAANESQRLAHTIDLESLHKAANMLGINETFVDGVFNRVETARYVSNDDGGKLLLLPLFDAASLNVVQSLGFIVFLVFLLLSAYSYISLNTSVIARDGSQRPYAPQPSRPAEWDLDSDRDWKAAIDATEAVALPWEHNDEDAGQHAPVVLNRPISMPDPGMLLQHMNHHLSSRPRIPQQGTEIRRGPLIVPVVNFPSDHPNSHHHVNNHQANNHHAETHHHPSPLRPARQPVLQHAVTSFPHSQPYEPDHLDHYDKHRHFASYEDDYQDKDDRDYNDEYFLDNRHHQHPHSKADTTRTPDNYWHPNPTPWPTHDTSRHTYHQKPSSSLPFNNNNNKEPSRRTTWQPRRTTPQPSSFPTTAQFPTTINLTPTPASLPNPRPTSKYAQRVTSSHSDKKGLKTIRTTITNR